MKALVTSLFCGFLFGLGLIVSGMSNPARVLNFLDWSANWDATLAFVMGGAIAIAAPGIYWARKQGSPLFADKFDIPTSTKIDSKLIFGAAIFGIGWGLAGYYPRPVVASLLLQPADMPPFFVTSLAGDFTGRWLHS